MAHGTLGLANEQLLPMHLSLGGQRRVELAVDVELGCGREVEDVHDLAHEVNLAAALEDVDALLGGDNRVAVEVRRALLELGEVLDRLQSALGAEEALDADAPERRRVEAVPELLWPDVAHEVGGAVGVAVDVAVEAGDAPAGLLRPAVVGQVELLLRRGRDQQPEALKLLGVENAVEELEVVVDRDDLALRDISEVRPSRQVDRGREVRQEVVGEVEVQVKARQIPAFLLEDLVDVELREHHPALGVVRVRQRQEALGEHAPVADLCG